LLQSIEIPTLPGCPEFLVESNSGLVPIQDNPFDPPVLVGRCEVNHEFEKLVVKALSSIFGDNISLCDFFTYLK
jgi:hypothetical protein